MFERTTDTGHTVYWNPENMDKAEQAMSEVVDRFDTWNGSRYELDTETARQVQSKYEDLTSK